MTSGIPGQVDELGLETNPEIAQQLCRFEPPGKALGRDCDVLEGIVHVGLLSQPDRAQLIWSTAILQRPQAKAVVRLTETDPLFEGAALPGR